MQKTIETIVKNFKEIENIGFLGIERKDKRFKKAFEIPMEELNELLKQYDLYAFQDEADENKNNEYSIDKIEFKERNEKLINGKINFKG